MTDRPIVRFLLATVRKDLQRRLRDPIALLIWIGIPVALGGLMSLLASGNGGVPTAKVLLVDQDQTFFSELISGLAGQGPLAEMMEIEEVDLDEGWAGIEANRATALLIVPKGFSDAVTLGEPAELQLIKNPAQRILPLVVEEAVEVLVEATFYVHELFGPQLEALATGPPSGQSTFADSTVMAMSVAINQRIAGMSDVLFPPVLTVETPGPAVSPGSGLNFGTLFLPGLVFMAILFIAQGMSDDVWEEKAGGTLRRVLTTPGGAGVFLGGKLLAGVVLVAIVALVGLATVVTFFGVALERLPLALLWSTFAGTTLLLYFILIQTFATSRRGGSLLTTILVFPLMMIGGSFFPFETMPDWMASIGRWTPNGLAVVRLKEMLIAQPEVSAVAVAAVGIGLPAVLAYAIAVSRLHGRFPTA